MFLYLFQNGVLNISRAEKKLRDSKEEEETDATEENYDSYREDDPLLPAGHRHTIN